MRKVLIVTDSLRGGGAEKVLYDILKNIDLKKYRIDIFLIFNYGIYKYKIEELGISIEGLFNERKDLINNIFYKKLKSLLIKIYRWIYCKYPFLIKKLKRKEYDIEIAFLEGYSSVLVANRKNNSKKIGWIHIDLEKHKMINRNLEMESYKKIDKIICVSNDSKISVENLYPELKAKIEVIYNPIPKEEILKNSLKESNIYSTEKVNLITVGRLNKQKGYDILLKTHNELLNEGLDYNLYILGEGEERKKLEQYIKDNNIERNTFLLGFKENPYPYIKEADVFISSSRYEGYSLVVAEALCLEKPVIATKCTGPVELLDNGKYGLLAEVENVESLKENMKKLILSEKLRKKYSELSKERAKIFDIKKTMKQIERVLYE